MINYLRNAGVTRCLPAWLRRIGYRLLGGERLDHGLWRLDYKRVMAEARRIPPDPARKPVGIVRDIMMKHSWYEAACLELGIPYHLIDITGEDWREQVQQAGCDLLFVRPFVLTPEGKALYDQRVQGLVGELGVRVFPEPDALRLYESKYRTTEWLHQHQVAQPETRVFHRLDEALEYIGRAGFPLVFKTDLGAETSGVRILRSRREAERLVVQCFGKGFRLAGRMGHVRLPGSMLLQEFIPDAREWRMVRIGDSFFGHRKGKRGDFHSGSKIIEFDTPPERLLDVCRAITDQGGFHSMALDILEPLDGRYLVIEMHTYFGCNSPHVMAVNGVPGRFLHTAEGWKFEPGDFNRNNSCNLRVAWAAGWRLHGKRKTEDGKTG